MLPWWNEQTPRSLKAMSKDVQVQILSGAPSCLQKALQKEGWNIVTIYVITNKVNRKQYVGKTSRLLKDRFHEH